MSSLWGSYCGISLDLEGGPPEELADKGLHSSGVHWESEQDGHGDHGPVVVVNPPGPDAAPIDLRAAHRRWESCELLLHSTALLQPAS